MSRLSKVHIIVLSVGLSVFSKAALAQGAASPATNPGSAPVKIGVVNIQDAIGSCNEGKKDLEALDAKFNPKRAELKALNDEVDSLKKNFETQGPKLSDEARTAQAKAIETKQKTLQRNFDDAQTEFQQAEQEVVNRIGTKMLAVLEKYAKDNSYAVVIDVSNPQTPVLWANPGNYITKELVDAYNVANPAVAPPAKASGAATTRPSTPAGAGTPKRP